MKEFIINGGKSKMILPTKLEEITVPYLKGVTKHINIVEHHAIIACIYSCKLLQIVDLSKKRKDMTATIVPLFVNANIPNDSSYGTIKFFNNITTGDKIIIAGTDIERGYHLTCPQNFITIDNVLRLYNSDSTFVKSIVTDMTNYYFASFKLVPIIDIKGFYEDIDDSFVNPFIIDNIEDIN